MWFIIHDLSGSRRASDQRPMFHDPEEAASVAVYETQRAVAGSPAISGGISLRCVRLGLLTHAGQRSSVGENVSLFREPDAGEPPVRFDEREQETEPSQTGLRRRCESSATHSHRETTATAPVLDSTQNNRVRRRKDLQETIMTRADGPHPWHKTRSL
jgi:hypothetical protein